MKILNKHFPSILTISLLAIFAIPFFCCSLEVSKDSKLIRPDVEKTGAGVAIRLKYFSRDTDYITLYRQDISEIENPDSPENKNPIERIGIIFPKQFDSQDQTYFFEDSMVFNGKTYRYKARLMEDSTTFETNWTDGIKVETGITDSALTIAYEIPSTTKIIYDSDYKIFTISGQILPPTGIPDFAEYEPALVFKTSSGIMSSIKLTEKVVLSNSSESPQPSDPLIPDFLTSGTKYKLTNLFTTDFYDTDITFLGIVGQKEEKKPDSTVTNPKIKRIFWSNLSFIPLYKSGILQDGGSNEIIPENTFRLDNQTGEAGYDYS
ncbi:MAG: hypothetical protein MJ188_08915 [Treponema sp.]|nr:hypothetical protein [Treponema sp.]